MIIIIWNFLKCKYYLRFYAMILSKTLKKISTSLDVLYRYVLTLALHQRFRDLCNGYAQCHHVRMQILFFAKISQILLKLCSLFNMKENVPIRLFGLIFQINWILFFLELNPSLNSLVRFFSWFCIVVIHHIDSINSKAFNKLTAQTMFGVPASRLSVLFCNE